MDFNYFCDWVVLNIFVVRSVVVLNCLVVMLASLALHLVWLLSKFVLCYKRLHCVDQSYNRPLYVAPLVQCAVVFLLQISGSHVDIDVFQFLFKLINLI